MVAASQSTNAVTRSPSTSVLCSPKSPCRRDNGPEGTTLSMWSSSHWRARGTAAMGGPLSSPMRAAMPFTAADSGRLVDLRLQVEARPGQRVERDRVQMGQGRGQLRPDGVSVLLGWHGQVGEVLARLLAPDPLHDEQGAAVVVAAGRFLASSAKNGRATGTPPWAWTACRMANSSDASGRQESDRPVLAHDDL